MKMIVDLAQNSEEWLRFRETRIGASDANIILGVSEFMTPRELWHKRMNPSEAKEPDQPNFIQQKGHRLEVQLRSVLELQLGHDFPPMVVVNDDFPAFMASLDGFCEELNATSEFKYVGQEDFELVRSGKMLDKYVPQVQQQLFLTNAEKCYFMVGTDDKDNKGTFKFTSIIVHRDQEYIEKKLIPAVHSFIDCINNNTPPALTGDDTLEQHEDDLTYALERYRLMTEELADVEQRIEKCKAEIFKLAKHTKVNCNGVMVYDIQAKDSESVDYKKWLEDSKIEVPAKYIKIKKGSRTKKIVFPKEA
jgi:putative phage-type endonuclease